MTKVDLAFLLARSDEWRHLAASSSMGADIHRLLVAADPRQKPQLIEEAVRGAFGNLPTTRPQAELVGIVHRRLVRTDLGKMGLKQVPCEKTVRAYVRTILAEKTGNSD